MRSRILPVLARPALLAWVVCGSLVAGGCGPGETISTYNVAKREAPKVPVAPPAGPTTDAGEYRFLGAMYPAEDPRWFVKFAGPADTVGAQAEKFDEFLKGFKVRTAEPEWTLPDGWANGPTRNGAMGITTRTVKAGTGNAAVELTVSQAAGGVQGNVARWVGQVGAAADGDLISKYTKPVTSADGVGGVKVDATGPTNPVAARGPMMGGR